MDNRTVAPAAQAAPVAPAAAESSLQPPVDPRAAELEAQRLANMATCLRFCANNIIDLETKMQDLDTHFSTFTNESGNRANLNKALMAAGAVGAAIYLILLLVYVASSSAERKLSTSNGMFYDFLAVYAIWYALGYTRRDPEERPFSWNAAVAKVIKDNDFKTLMTEYDDFVVCLEMLSKNLHNTYNDNNATLQLIYADLENEIKVFKDKDNMTVSKAREEMKKVNEIVEFTTSVLSYTKGYSPHLFDRRPARRAQSFDLRVVDDATYLRGMNAV